METKGMFFLAFLTILFLGLWAVLFGIAWAGNGAFGADLKKVDIYVRDGDTFVVNGQPVRVAYIDAPEKGQYFFSQSKNRLADLLANGSDLQCVQTGTSYNRIVANCNVDSQNIGYLMVREGYAFHASKWSSGVKNIMLTYAQILARISRKGVWSQKDIVYPWNYRKK